MVDIIHRVGIKKPVAEVYRAIATVEGIAGWWTKDTTGVSELGGRIAVQFSRSSGEHLGGMTMEVMALEPNRLVHWRFRSGPAEWIDTDAIFQLSQEGDYTVVRFGHRNWREAVEFTEHCSTKWAIFLMSLKAFVETGKGRPAPDDVQISNWH
jgi:uncharacterized protein YndB with AHSA1/START domain